MPRTRLVMTAAEGRSGQPWFDFRPALLSEDKAESKASRYTVSRHFGAQLMKGVAKLVIV